MEIKDSWGNVVCKINSREENLAKGVGEFYSTRPASGAVTTVGDLKKSGTCRSDTPRLSVRLDRIAGNSTVTGGWQLRSTVNSSLFRG